MGKAPWWYAQAGAEDPFSLEEQTMTATLIDYEIELLRSTKEILLGFIDKSHSRFISGTGINPGIIAADAKAIADALHGAVKQA